MILKLSQIVTTAGTQIRAAINEDIVAQYAEAMVNGDKFPPVVVFHDGSQYLLADGFHRVLAAARNDFLDIEADVRKGARQDALRHALTANCSHGLRRTNADKRRSVELALAEWPKMSDREIARVCAVNDHTVADVRKLNCGNSAVETRIGADGKKRKLPVKSDPSKWPRKVDINHEWSLGKSEQTIPHIDELEANEQQPDKPRVEAANLEDYADHGQKRDLDLACIKTNIEATVTNVIHYAPKGELAAFKLFLEREAARVGMANRQYQAEAKSKED